MQISLSHNGKCSNKIFNRTMTISGLELAWRTKNDGFPFMTSLQMIVFLVVFLGNVDQLRRYGGTRHQMADLPNVFTVHWSKDSWPIRDFQSPPQNIENCPSFHPKYREGGRGSGHRKGNNYKDPVTGDHMGHLSKLWDDGADKKIIKTLRCHPMAVIIDKKLVTATFLSGTDFETTLKV